MILQSNSWTRYLSWPRVLLAVAAVIFAVAASPRIPSYLALLAVYLIAAVAAATRKHQAGMLGLLALFIDTMCFLIVANYGGVPWLGALFFLYVLAESLTSYGPVEAGVITVCCSVSAIVLRGEPIHDLDKVIVVAGTLACGFAVSKQRQTRFTENLSSKYAEATKAAEKARDEERQRIASDFHDGPLQSFISLQMRLEILRKLMDRDMDAGMQDLKQLQALAQSQVRDLRAFLHSMRPVDVDGANLVATARRTAETFQKESGIPVTFLGTNKPVGLPSEMTTEALQLLREALHNVQKHAAATRVAVGIERNDRWLEITVDDNGHGFNFSGTYSLDELELLRLGPASLKRRARSIGADLSLESRPGSGSGLMFRIPLQ